MMHAGKCAKVACKPQINQVQLRDYYSGIMPIDKPLTIILSDGMIFFEDVKTKSHFIDICEQRLYIL